MTGPRAEGRGGFLVRCEARDPLRALTAFAGLTIRVSQRIRYEGAPRMWDSAIVHCDEEIDGTLVLRILVSNPDWPEPVQIASLQSRPGDEECGTALGCNLDHVSASIFEGM